MAMPSDAGQTDTAPAAEENVKQDAPLGGEQQQGTAGNPEPEQPDVNPDQVEQKEGPEEREEQPEETGEEQGEGEEYELEMPEGFEVDEAALGKFSEFAGGVGMSQEQAQAAMDMHTQLMQQAFEKQQADYVQMRQGWVEELNSDPNFAETHQRAANAMQRFGSDELRELFDMTGVGDNPHLVRMFANIDKAMGEDTLVEGESTREIPLGDRLYKNS